MLAARLHGARDVRIEQVPEPSRPGPAQALVRIKAVGICGSDLHAYQDGRIGDTKVSRPLIQGHEFGGIIETVGVGGMDGEGRPLIAGMHVAVDPAQPCLSCDLCEQGHPNLCRNIRFCGLSPDDGALCERMVVPARNCFPVPKEMDFGEVALLETLGVALHAVDLAKIRVGQSLAIFGAGPVGLCIGQVARRGGAGQMLVSDKFPWRLELAKKFGAKTACCESDDVVRAAMDMTAGKGVDVAIEAAWAGDAAQQAVEAVRPGARVVLVGIPGDDRLVLRHSTIRRKGLTIKLARRMKHVYPRAIAMWKRGEVDLKSMISHRFPLEKTAEAFKLNDAYESGVVKVIVDI